MIRGGASVSEEAKVLLIGIDQVEQGMHVGAPIMHPRAPGMSALQPGAKLNGAIIARLRSLGISQLWVEDDLTADLDAAVAPGLTMAKLELYSHLKRDLTQISRQTISTTQIRFYREAVRGLVRELVATGKVAGLTDQMFASETELFSHSTNVAYLAILVGLELESYLIHERPRVSARRARDVANLGLAGMLHDLGKVGLSSNAQGIHEVLGRDEDREGIDYDRHPVVGYKMLVDAGVPTTARHAVLHHHQRFDGSGWPDMAKLTRGRVREPQAGRRIHVFTRIVAAANVLDNLLSGADGNQRPPVAALHDFADSQFDGWFDPVVRLAVLRRIPPFAVGSQVRLSDGQSAVVIAPNLRQPCRPTVRLLHRSPQPSELPHTTLNLVDHRALHITAYAGVDVEKWLFELPAETAWRPASC
ncbi:MAG: HD domain-containing protein [Phycisphaerales bacterium]